MNILAFFILVFPNYQYICEQVLEYPNMLQYRINR